MNNNIDNSNHNDKQDNQNNNTNNDNDNDNDNKDFYKSSKSLLEEIDNIDNNSQNTFEEQINKIGEDSAFSDIINNLKTLGNEDSLNNLFKDFTESFQNCNNNNNNNNNNDDADEYEGSDDNYDFETLNLDKYLLDNNSGSNICNILSNICVQLENINLNLDKMHNK